MGLPHGRWLCRHLQGRARHAQSAWTRNSSASRLRVSHIGLLGEDSFVQWPRTLQKGHVPLLPWLQNHPALPRSCERSRIRTAARPNNEAPEATDSRLQAGLSHLLTKRLKWKSCLQYPHNLHFQKETGSANYSGLSWPHRNKVLFKK